MFLYSIEVKLCATAYIKAKNQEEASKLLREHFGQENNGQMVEVDDMTSDQDYEDPDLPAVSVSPVMTGYGAFSKPEDFDIAAEYSDE
jgi:hypothetical protein